MKSDLLNAPKTRALLTALELAHVDVSPGSGLHTALEEFAHTEATKTADLVAEFERSLPPMTLLVKTTAEAQRLLDTVRSQEQATITALADALESAKVAMWRGEFGPRGRDQHVPAQVDAALRFAGRLP